jgi:hypothetical protein
MKRNILLDVIGYILVLGSFISFIVALHMETGKQFWIVTFISIGYLVLSGLIFNHKEDEETEEGF